VWHQRLPLSTFIAAPTIKEFANVLRQESSVTTWSSLVPIESRGEKPPLFCIHPVGGNILEYYPLAAHLSVDRPIYGLQSPGLDGRQAPLCSIEAMAAYYIKEIQSIQPQGPYLLVGYSFGGVVAVEIARQLDLAGKQIGLLALLDRESPNLSEIRPSFMTSVGIHWRNLQQLDLSERFKYIKDRVVFRTLYRHRADKEKAFLLDNWAEPLPPEYLQVLEANFQADKNYIGKFYPGRAILFRSTVQPVALALHPDLGWGDLIGGGVEVRDIPGHHNDLLREPYIQILAAELKLCLG
jgi:thioesterase domain-containing protein